MKPSYVTHCKGDHSTVQNCQPLHQGRPFPKVSFKNNGNRQEEKEGYEERPKGEGDAADT